MTPFQFFTLGLLLVAGLNISGGRVNGVMPWQVVNGNGHAILLILAS